MCLLTAKQRIIGRDKKFTTSVHYVAVLGEPVDPSEMEGDDEDTVLV